MPTIKNINLLLSSAVHKTTWNIIQFQLMIITNNSLIISPINLKKKKKTKSTNTTWPPIYQFRPFKQFRYYHWLSKLTFTHFSSFFFLNDIFHFSHDIIKLFILFIYGHRCHVKNVYISLVKFIYIYKRMWCEWVWYNRRLVSTHCEFLKC